MINKNKVYSKKTTKPTIFTGTRFVRQSHAAHDRIRKHLQRSVLR